MIDCDADEVRNLMKEAKECLPDIAEATAKFEEAERSFNELIESYENRISILDGDVCDKDDEIDSLQEKIDELESYDTIETAAEKILAYYESDAHGPSLGEVMSLRDDIAKLLAEKYNIPAAMFS